MSGPANLSKVDRLRSRDGDLCWLCTEPFDFRPEAKKTRRPTLEHLQPKSLGGTNDLSNLRLCHDHCNRQLADRPRQDKERIREKRIRRLKEKNAQAVTRPGTVTRSVAVKSEPKVVRAERPDAPRDLVQSLQIAISVATFFAGLALGLLLAR